MTNLIKVELINIIRFCLKIYDLWRHSHLWVDESVNGRAHVWVVGWVGGSMGGSGQMTKHLINVDLIKII